jgi:hypothetical protein
MNDDLMYVCMMTMMFFVLSQKLSEMNRASKRP